MGFFVGVPIFLFVRIRVRVGDGFRDGVRLFVGERFFDGVRIEGDGFRDGVLRVCVAEGRFAEKVGRIDFVGEVRFAVKVGRIVFVGDGFFDGVLLVREGEAFLGELVGGRMVFDGDWAIEAFVRVGEDRVYVGAGVDEIGFALGVRVGPIMTGVRDEVEV
mmetsp:Transcript_1949/g.3447  ORF Transcript_1949/g.3447 Transcript_1949/m.3447 type:complete len:161 (-) Transcript_1949:266-748(-)|eukprot:CAMPEP_0184656380 /NCGR_PEP_ID=MMETSP0308-20130426/16462_1 /TAXON_ID=38269 /ORGANISM="Gloeochaete witrockiana, Strain SAG 46.84" /LENGTH=160 /DNA_ID=CAMNT_0027093491 /DNA_START=1696 /DNA_END=2178 /DNA_ORIENTATION=-